MNHLASRWRFFAVTATGAALDLLTKWMAFGYLRDLPFGTHQVIDGLFRLKAVTNRGSLWGLFSDYPVPLTLVTSSIFLMLLVLAMFDWGRGPRMQVALGLFCAGAVGNLSDRIYFGHVRDFLDVYVLRWHWPTFNLADVCICAGAAVFLWAEVLAAREARSEAAVEEVA